MLHGIYKNKKVFITGHTGFKGSWLALWLHSIGAEVVGYSLPADEQSHFKLLDLPIKSYFQNINDEGTLLRAMQETKPDIIFHLAAQPLVRDSYDDPIKTYETNVLGTMKVYWSALKAGVESVVSITTDKVYENHEWFYGYREVDTLGGHDPYSSSKACVELMTDSFKKSFLFDDKMYLATVRAGNVIGGGDWAKDRLIPDLVRNASVNKTTSIRNPYSIRPWQHVLEPLHGYLLVGEQLLLKKKEFCTSFNFGPESKDVASVDQMCIWAKKAWSAIDVKFVEDTKKHEAGLLKLDSTKAHEMLKWNPKWSSVQTTELTVDWYKNYYENNKISSLQNLKDYIELLSL